MWSAITPARSTSPSATDFTNSGRDPYSRRMASWTVIIPLTSMGSPGMLLLNDDLLSR